MKLGVVPSLVAGTALTVAAGAAAVVYIGGEPEETEPTVAVNPEARDALLAKGIPAASADFFSATKVEGIEANPLSVRYRELYADGAVRIVTITYMPEKRYDLEPAEVAAAREAGRSTYRAQYTHGKESGGTQTRLQFFVPYESMSKDLTERLRPPGRGALPAGGGSRPAMQLQSPGVGADVVVEGLLQESTLQSAGQAVEAISKVGEALQSTAIQNIGQGLGVVVAGVDAANDIAGAYDLRLEYLAYMTELARLRRCAQNPTSNGVNVPPAERARTGEYLERLESDIRSMTEGRYLNQVADAPLNLLGAAPVANPAGAAIAAAVSVLVKPMATWSEETLKQAIQNRMDAARQAVPFCDDTCESRQAPPPVTSPFPAPGQNFSPGPIPNPSPPRGPSCDPASATVTYRYIDRWFPRDGGTRDHLVTFSAVAELTNIVKMPTGGGGTFEYRLPDYSGKGTGRYRETEETAHPGCSRGIAINGDALMEVRVQTVDFTVDPRTGAARVTATLGEVNVQVRTTSAARSDSGFCDPGSGNTYTAVGSGPEYGVSCTFFGVDLQNGGRYRADESTDHTDDDETRDEDCLLDLGPLKFEMPPLAQGTATARPEDGRPARP